MNTKEQAIEKTRSFLAGATNKHLAMLIEVAITGESSEVGKLEQVDAQLMQSIEPYIREEARVRVGDAAHAESEADWEIVKAKWGLREDMTEEEMDEIYDNIPDDEFKQSTPGEWFYLVKHLRK